MSEGVASRWKQAITWLIAIGFGGLGGAFFNNWYANRSTVIEYSVNRAVLGTDQTAVVPNFRVQVGDTSLQSLYIYTVRVQYSSGPELENAKIGIGLLTPNVKLVGKTVAEKPSEAFDISCGPFETGPKSSGATCTVRRFNSHVGAYAVSFATDADAKVDVSVDARNTQVKQAGIAGTSEASASSTVTAIFLGFVVVLAAFGTAARELVRAVETTDPKTLRANPEGPRPELEIDYEGTAANKVEVNPRTDVTEVAEIYIRARVRNTGLQTAKGSLVYLTSLREVQASGTTPTSFYGSGPLAWEGWEFQPRDIPQGVTFYVDLMKVSKHAAGWLFSVQKPPSSLKNYSGTYRFQLTLTADDAVPATCEVDVTYTQDWHTLRAVAVPKVSDRPSL